MINVLLIRGNGKLMWFKQYRAVIKIESNTVCCQITHSLGGSCIFEQKNDLEFDVNQVKIEEMIHKLFESIRQSLPSVKQSQFIIDIHIDPLNVKHKILQLPTTRLLASEIPLLVEASIYKLFGLSPHDVAFDYAHHVKNKHQLYVAICARNYISQWVELFVQLNCSVQFIGLSFDNNTKFNFLPWRLSLQRKRKMKLVIMCIAYLNLLVLTLGYLWWQSNNDLYKYNQLADKNQLIEQTLLNKRSEKLSYHLQKKQPLHQFLILLSDKIPESIFLDSLNYSPLKINITGKAFSYIDITEFSDLLKKEKRIQTNEITSVTLDKNELLFQMDIDLYEQ